MLWLDKYDKAYCTIHGSLDTHHLLPTRMIHKSTALCAQQPASNLNPNPGQKRVNHPQPS
jgi:hypothetical protein